MPLTVVCPGCQSRLTAPDYAAGRPVKCPQCGQAFAGPPADAAGIQTSPNPLALAGPALTLSRPDGDAGPLPDPSPGLVRGLTLAPTGLQTGLGLAALALGVVGLVIAFFPGRAAVGLVVCGAGLLLGGVGLLVGLARRKQGLGLPTAGLLVSGVGLAVVAGWLFLLTTWVRTTEHLRQGLTRAEAARKPGEVGNPAPNLGPGAPVDDLGRKLQQEMGELGKVFDQLHEQRDQARDIFERLRQRKFKAFLQPPGGSLELRDGVAQLQGEFTRADRRDGARRGRTRKVYATFLEAGKTYQIEMTSQQLHCFLYLESSIGHELAQDEGGRKEARILFRCERTDPYRVIASAAPEDVGTFTLTVRQQK
jgi:hypothetical protein